MNRRMRRRGRGLVASAILLATALVAQGGITTDATWNDAERVHGQVGAVPCTDPVSDFATRGEGRALSGSLLGIDLDALAEASGMLVTHDGEAPGHYPAGANPLPPPAENAWTNPLNVTALRLVNANLGNGMLQLPLNNSTGVIGQYGQARSDSTATGAAGFITESGGIATSPANGYPHLASLSVAGLLDSVNLPVTELLGAGTDVSVEVGAVTGRATLDACARAWEPESTAAALSEAVTREYLAASFETTVSSPTISALASQLDETVGGLQGTIDQLVGQQSVTTALVNAVTRLLDGLLGLLGLGNIGVKKLHATIDLSPVRDLLSSPFSDAHGTLTVDPGAGSVTIDAAALLQQAYPGQYGDGLNGLPPNTNPLADPTILNTLTTALGSILADWLDRIEGTLRAQVENISVSAEVDVTVRLLVPVATITASVDGSLADLLAGTVRADTDLELLGSISLGLLNPLLNALANGLGKAVGDVLSPVLASVHTLPPAVTSLTEPIITAVSHIYTRLFLDGVVSITVNAQNDPGAGGPEPADWEALPAGRYDVAALRIGVLGAAGANDAHLYLGRGSVGPGCPASDGAPACVADW